MSENIISLKQKNLELLSSFRKFVLHQANCQNDGTDIVIIGCPVTNCRTM